jgi:hypothetical protein
MYVGWSWVAQANVSRNVQDALAALQLQDAPVFLTPTPFNTLLWRAVVMTDDGYLEGFDSLVIDEGTMQFTAHASEKNAIDDAGDIWAVNRLRWFSQACHQRPAHGARTNLRLQPRRRCARQSALERNTSRIVAGVIRRSGHDGSLGPNLAPREAPVAQPPATGIVA